MRIILTSDTHGHHARLTVPEGDIFIHAGDMTRTGTLQELRDFNAWLGTLSYTHKFVIAGNHDWCWQRDKVAALELLTHAVYLEDSGAKVEGVTLWGSPWQPDFHDFAFNLPRGEALRAKWALIPEATDILVTHGPPYGVGDRTIFFDRAGCRDLTRAVERIAPRLHAFGHIHEGYGVTVKERTTFVNASMCLPFNRPVDRVIVIEWETLTGAVGRLRRG